MSRHTLSSHAVALSTPSRTAIAGRLARLKRFVLDRFLLLPIAAAIALIWANIRPASYFSFSQALRFPVNDIGMALVFGLLAQEILEELMPGGSLHTWRRWATPVVGAIGGTIIAPVIFLAYVRLAHETVLAQAWPVACAVDVVAAYYVCKMLRLRRPVRGFAMLMAICANGIALLILAPRQPFAEIPVTGVLLITIALGTAAIMRRRRVASFWPYGIVSVPLMWAGFFLSGLQPALAIVPIVLFLPHKPRRLDDFPDTPDDDATHHAEHEWNEAVQVILFLFGLVNAGVVLRGYGTGTWAFLVAVMVGRPIGTLLAVALASFAGLHLSARVGWRDLVVVAFANSSGFTLALFFAVGIVPLGPVLSEIKIGVLSTMIGAAVAFAVAATLGVGRFAHRRSHPA